MALYSLIMYTISFGIDCQANIQKEVNNTPRPSTSSRLSYASAKKGDRIDEVIYKPRDKSNKGMISKFILFKT